MKGSINKFCQGPGFCYGRAGFLRFPPLCTVTTCETLPTDGTKVYASQGKGPKRHIVCPWWTGHGLTGRFPSSDARVTSRRITDFSVRVHHNVEACSCANNDVPLS
jgi:hypothetical protein